MSLTTPTVAELKDDIVGYLEAKLAQTMPFFAKSFSHVLAYGLAGKFILLWKYVGASHLNQYIQYASAEETVVNGKRIRPLIELGRQIGVGDPRSATRAELVVEVPVEIQTGRLPAGTQMLFPATGVLYLTTAAVALDAPTVQVTVRASSIQGDGTAAGVIGNRDPGDVLEIANPLANIGSTATVLSQAVTGADGETVAEYRARVLRRNQRKPQGGAYADYQAWGEEVAGILNVYPYTGAPGEVDLYVEATVASSDEDGIPTAAQLSAVLAAVELDDNGLATRRPANAAVNVHAITRTAFDLEVSGLVADDDSAAQEAIETAVDEYLRSREPFIVGLSTLPRLDRVEETAIAGVVSETVGALGATITGVELLLNGVPTPVYTLGNGEKSKLGSVSYM